MKLTREKIMEMTFEELGERILEELDSVESRADFLRGCIN